jgi:lipid II:glycine glycyltransferase (peptidoglycan interpeptide bridge formation enzyme)
MYPYYFLQQDDWANFWLSANLENHSFFEVYSDNKALFSKIYIYPWELGQKFGYLARFPAFCLVKLKSLKQEDFENETFSLLKNIKDKAKELGLIFIKFDFDNQFLSNAEDVKKNTNFNLNPKNQDFNLLFQEIFVDKLGFSKINLKTKKIQYLATMTLDLKNVLKKLKNTDSLVNEKFYELKKLLEKGKILADNSVLSDFYNFSQDFWQTTNQNVRRYTKKSLKQNWQISLNKTQDNFEKFYQIYLKTSQRQKFAIHSKDYLQKFFDSSFSKVIILEDKNNQPQAVWLGIRSDQTLTYICGGNTEISFKNYGQYLIHLVAIFVASLEKLSFYDLGGYDPKLSFSDFKKNYRGDIRQFPGPLDVVIKPIQYDFTNTLIKLVKLFKKS